mmetsp:Transcript_63856/g.103226  ORF Transcript_63856/g.103226 Transcript_63856/m.103226 type:complete len:219 (-) Transcript_63856:32-688(-)
MQKSVHDFCNIGPLCLHSRVRVCALNVCAISTVAHFVSLATACARATFPLGRIVGTGAVRKLGVVVNVHGHMVCHMPHHSEEADLLEAHGLVELAVDGGAVLDEAVNLRHQHHRVCTSCGCLGKLRSQQLQCHYSIVRHLQPAVLHLLNVVLRTCGPPPPQHLFLPGASLRNTCTHEHVHTLEQNHTLFYLAPNSANAILAQLDLGVLICSSGACKSV